MARLCFWIQHVLTFGFREKSKSETEKFEKLLQMLQTFSPNVQCLPVVEGFLTRYLPTWDGQACASMIFSLITCIRPSSFQDLFSGILEPLHRLFFSSDIYFKSMCVTALTKLLHNQVMHILVPPGESQDGRSRQTASGAASTNQHFSSSQASQDSSQEEDSVGKGKGSVDSGPAGEASKRWPGGLDITSTTTVDESVATEIILKLIKFLDTVVVVAMRMEDDHYLLQHVTLDFLHLTSQICQKYTVPVVCLPIQVIHRLLFSDCPATLARLCNIINLFREAFSKVPSTMASSSMMMGEMSNGRRVFNSLLLDTLGMLWQGRMFSDRGQKYPSIFSFTLPRELKPKVQENALTVYLGPAFMGLAYKFLKETQPEGKKVHPALIEDFKDQYLQFLERENFPEFKELVNKNIKNRKASVPAKVAS
ncbi:centromere protein I-like [Aplysia californica]|uniref:Centromere protein I-like n=1 Tax=Aplysia californica TaxID=6500 RepID=A0ABM1AB59_APLCA|nr:centromere protein I-like [Aplysia californica]